MLRCRVNSSDRDHAGPLGLVGIARGPRAALLSTLTFVIANTIACSACLVSCAPDPIQRATESGGPGSSPTDQPNWITQSDDWYSLTLAAARAGWMRVVREDDGHRYRTTNEMTLKFNQGGAQFDIDSYVEWIEGHDGQPLRLVVARKDKEKLASVDAANASVWEKTRDGDPLGLLTSKRAWEFDGTEVTKIASHGEKKVVRTSAPKPGGEWLTPAATQELIRRRISEDAGAIEYGMIDAPDSLRYVGVTSTLVGRSEFGFDGVLIPVTVWRTQTSINPGQTISHYSPDGKLMSSSVDLGVGVLETRLCKKEEALFDAVAALPVKPTAVKPDRELTATSRTVFEVRLKEGKLPQLPSAGSQTVEISADGASARITVVTGTSSAATSAELEDVRLREGSPIVGSADPVILDLAAHSLRETEGMDNLDLAKSSRAVVHRHFARRIADGSSAPVPKGGMQLFDTDLERAKTLCAVLRIHRIASRIVSGLAYAAQPNGQGVFEWTMWTQALVDGRWVDLDPTGLDQFNGGHILTGLGSLSAMSTDPDPVGFAKLLSQVEIKVVSQQ
ncbi:MAG: transglutaminase domain-containing protein [Phycisphaerales bacterium]|nr:transglutaminase domain-containing protein [Phycisphaerales bacterium]